MHIMSDAMPVRWQLAIFQWVFAIPVTSTSLVFGNQACDNSPNSLREGYFHCFLVVAFNFGMEHAKSKQDDPEHGHEPTDLSISLVRPVCLGHVHILVDQKMYQRILVVLPKLQHPQNAAENAEVKLIYSQNSTQVTVVQESRTSRQQRVHFWRWQSNLQEFMVNECSPDSPFQGNS